MNNFRNNNTRLWQRDRRIENYLEDIGAMIHRSMRLCRCGGPVEQQWTAFRGEGRSIYAPVIDLAIGPFAVDLYRYESEYNHMSNSLRGLLSVWIGYFQYNWTNNYKAAVLKTESPPPHNYNSFYTTTCNRNSRCFLAIELENRTGTKHLMGSIVNAGALGRLGILVAWNSTTFRTALRMREYFDYLKDVGKTYFDMNNVIILTREQVEDGLNTFLENA